MPLAIFSVTFQRFSLLFCKKLVCTALRFKKYNNNFKVNKTLELLYHTTAQLVFAQKRISHWYSWTKRIIFYFINYPVSQWCGRGWGRHTYFSSGSYFLDINVLIFTKNLIEMWNVDLNFDYEMTKLYWKLSYFYKVKWVCLVS